MTAKLSRRSALKGVAAFAAIAAAGENPAGATRRFFGPGSPPLGLQLYTLGVEALKDLDATFSQVARIGYRAVELVGFAGHKPEEVRAALDRAGLIAPSAHFTFQSFGDEPNLSSNLPEIIAGAQHVGVQNVVSSMFEFPARFGAPKTGEELPDFIGRVASGMRADEWKSYAEKLNATGAALKGAGLRIAHHNHNVEFVPVGASSGYDLIARGTDPELVSFELDIGWVAAAGLDPIVLLDRYPGRVTMMHIKDIKPSTVPNYALRLDPTEVGTGIVKVAAVLRTARRAGVTGFYVEQEPPFSIARMEAVRRSYEFLARLPA